MAVVTRESSQSLGLKEGAKAFALIKASSVIVITDAQGVRLSARNLLAGKVQQVKPGAVNAEVLIELPGGAVVTAIVTADSAQDLGLAPGSAATAMVKASSVIVGVPA